MFDFTRVRGAGAWLEGDQVVVNTGANLIIDGEIKGLHESPGVFVYEKQAIIPYRTTGAMEVTERSSWISSSALIGRLRCLLMRWLAGCSWRPGAEGCSGGGHMYGLSGLMVLVNHG